MKVAVVFDIKDGTSRERAQNLALGIATMANAAVRGEPDVSVDKDTSPLYCYDGSVEFASLYSLLEKK